MNSRETTPWAMTTRTLGVIVLLGLLYAFLIQEREVSAAWLVLAGGLLGSEFLPWPQREKE